MGSLLVGPGAAGAQALNPGFGAGVGGVGVGIGAGVTPVTLDDILDSPAAFAQRLVQVRGQVSDVIGRNAFVLNDIDRAFDREILVVAPAGLSAVAGLSRGVAVQPGMIVSVTGWVQPFNTGTFDQLFGLGLGTGRFASTFAGFGGQPAILAWTVQPLGFGAGVGTGFGTGFAQPGFGTGFNQGFGTGFGVQPGFGTGFGVQPGFGTGVTPGFGGQFGTGIGVQPGIGVNPGLGTGFGGFAPGFGTGFGTGFNQGFGVQPGVGAGFASGVGVAPGVGVQPGFGTGVAPGVGIAGQGQAVVPPGQVGQQQRAVPQQPQGQQRQQAQQPRQQLPGQQAQQQMQPPAQLQGTLSPGQIRQNVQTLTSQQVTVRGEVTDVISSNVFILGGEVLVVTAQPFPQQVQGTLRDALQQQNDVRVTGTVRTFRNRRAAERELGIQLRGRAFDDLTGRPIIVASSIEKV